MTTINSLLEQLKIEAGLAENFECWKHIPAKPPKYGDWPKNLHPKIIDAIRERGIDKLYTHQTEAVNQALQGKNVVVVTPTASGKTLCYNLPVLDRVLNNEHARALYLFPTKALSQDQMLELHDFSKVLKSGIKVYTFDGDTPASARRAIRSSGQIVVTNPDMLHSGILPHHTIWVRLFENLEVVVIDELHQYRGVFGSHMANVIRRLKRIAKFYGKNPQFILCSATIANPKELAEELIEDECLLVDNNGAPSGEKHFLFYNPPVVNPELGIRRSVIKESERLAIKFVMNKVPTIMFARSRLRVELLLTHLRRELERLKINPNLIAGYRGGYLPNERREIEKGLRNGSIIGVVSTNALELGIDIGQLEVSIMAGYPGTISSTWQQGGRAGRRMGTSVVILVGSSAPLDQFFMTHPDFFFGSNPENGIINPNNPVILTNHLKCGAFELPYDDGEGFGDVPVEPLLEYLEREMILRHTGGRWFWTSETYPAEEISLRTANVENFVVVDTTHDNKVIAEVDYDSAPFLIHDEAIYIHQSLQYYIEKLDWEKKTAFAKEIDSDYYTDAQAKTDVKVLSIDMESALGKKSPAHFDDYDKHPSSKSAHSSILNFITGDGYPSELDHIPANCKVFGTVSVVTLATKFKKIKFETLENIGYGEIHLPEQEMQTESYWIVLGPDMVEGWIEKDIGGAIRGLATVLLNVVPIYVMCDPKDIRAVPMVRAPLYGLPTVFLYDRYPGGIGIAERIYERHDEIKIAARDLIKDCKCKHGCPSCVGPPLEVGSMGKERALEILEKTLWKIIMKSEEISQLRKLYKDLSDDSLIGILLEDRRKYDPVVNDLLLMSEAREREY